VVSATFEFVAQLKFYTTLIHRNCHPAHQNAGLNGPVRVYAGGVLSESGQGSLAPGSCIARIRTSMARLLIRDICVALRAAVPKIELEPSDTIANK
jgi:hypothetical protein